MYLNNLLDFKLKINIHNVVNISLLLLYNFLFMNNIYAAENTTRKVAISTEFIPAEFYDRPTKLPKAV